MSALGKDRRATLTDAEYFSTQLIRVLESLNRTEPSRHNCPQWQQSAAMTRRVRGFAREQIQKHRGERRALGMRERTRT